MKEKKKPWAGGDKNFKRKIIVALLVLVLITFYLITFDLYRPTQPTS
jgi:hypothetical protein